MEIVQPLVPLRLLVLLRRGPSRLFDVPYVADWVKVFSQDSGPLGLGGATAIQVNR